MVPALMTDPYNNDPLAALDAKLRAAEHAHDPGSQAPDAASMLGRVYSEGFKLAIELFACTAIGILLGYGLDKWLGTKPWGFIILMILGVVAGFRNFYVFARNLDKSIKKDDLNLDG